MDLPRNFMQMNWIIPEEFRTGVKYNALSVDHLECTGDEEIKALLGSETMPTLLPGSAFFLGLADPPAQENDKCRLAGCSCLGL